MPWDPADPSDIAPAPLDRPAQEVLDALLRVATALHLEAPEAALYDVPIDLYAANVEALRDAAGLVRTAAAVVAQAAMGTLDREPTSLAPTSLAPLRDQLLDTARDLRAGANNGAAVPDDAIAHRAAAEVAAEVAAEDVAYAIREQALEHDHDLLLAMDAESGRPTLFGKPVNPDTAQVWLLERVFQRLEHAACATALTLLERAAARWWFSRWSASTRRSPLQDETFAHHVREQEWSLTERTTLQDGASVLGAFVYTPAFAAIPSRQQALARALRRARSGIFQIRHMRDDTVTMEDLRSHELFSVHEHRVPPGYSPDAVMLGRLIPIRPGRWLRSPGALIVAPPDPRRAEQYVTALAHAIDGAASDISRGIALEAIISTTIGGAKVPCHVPPAPSRDIARVMHEQAFETLRAAGLSEAAPADEIPAALAAQMRDAGVEGAQAFRYAVDEPVGAWVTALGKQAAVLGGQAHDAGSRGRRSRRRRS